MQFIKRHSKKLIVLFILAAIAVSVAFVLLRPESASTPSTTPTQTNDTNAQESSQPKASQAMPGAYVDYSEAALASAKGTKILFFYAPWCPQCRALDASIRASALPDALTLLKVDYDTNQALRQKYGVTLQTTLVQVDDAGKKLKSFVAYDSPSFDAVKTAFGL